MIGESAPPTKQVKGDEHMARVCPAAATADGGYFPIPLNKEREAARLISSHVRIGLARSLARAGGFACELWMSLGLTVSQFVRPSACPTSDSSLFERFIAHREKRKE